MIERDAMSEIKPKNKKIVVEKQAPVHPGQILLEEFLEPYGITQAELARHIGVNLVVVNDVVRRKRGINPRLALLFGDAFGNGPEIWFNMQTNYDFCRERDTLRRTGKVKRIGKLSALTGTGK
jgi:addiction module HigA family antidote